MERTGAGTGALLRGALGAVTGALVGYLVFTLLHDRGYYVQGLAGTLTGLGCGLLSRRRSWVLAGASALIAVFIGLYCESRVQEWAADMDFAAFLADVGRLAGEQWIRIGAGTLFGGWFGLGRNPPPAS